MRRVPNAHSARANCRMTCARTFTFGPNMVRSFHSHSCISSLEVPLQRGGSETGMCTAVCTTLSSHLFACKYTSFHVIASPVRRIAGFYTVLCMRAYFVHNKKMQQFSPSPYKSFFLKYFPWLVLTQLQLLQLRSSPALCRTRLNIERIFHVDGTRTLQ